MAGSCNKSTFRKFPKSQFIIHLLFFFSRSIIFILFNTDLLQSVKTSKAVLLIRRNFTFSFLFYIFQFYLVTKSLIFENMYSFRLGIVLMIHNAVLTLFVLGVILQTSLTFHDTNLIFNWILTSIISLSYILESFLSCVFLRKMTNQKMSDQFFRICIDPKINEMYSIRVKTRTFTEIKAFLSFLDFGRYFFTPNDHFKRPFIFIIVVIFLTISGQILILADFNGENTVQRWAAIAVIAFDIFFDVITIVFLLVNTRQVYQIRLIVILITYIDVLIITLVVGYFLIKDMRHFNKGLKEAMTNRIMGNVEL